MLNPLQGLLKAFHLDRLIGWFGFSPDQVEFNHKLVNALQSEGQQNIQNLGYVRLAGTALWMTVNLLQSVIGDSGLHLTMLPRVIAFFIGACIIQVTQFWRKDFSKAFVYFPAFFDLPMMTFIFLAPITDDFPMIYRAVGTAHFFALCILITVLALMSFNKKAIIAIGISSSICTYIFLKKIGFARIDFVTGTIAVLVGATAGMIGILKQVSRNVSKALSSELKQQKLRRYFSPEIAKVIESSGTTYHSHQKVQITAVFVDIRNFVGICEKLSADQTGQFLNRYFQMMTEIVFRHHGTLDKFIGDGMFVYFGFPESSGRHALDALTCTKEMLSAVKDFNQANARDRNLPAVSIGVGICSGEVIAGDFGMSERRDFTVIGQSVNKAARIEKMTRRTGDDILVSESTRNLVGNQIAFRNLGAFQIRGMHGDHQLFVPIFDKSQSTVSTAAS